ncbi:MAG: hypothetical protein RL708_1334 [Bacteroidota bacterium]|jgi:uncharacterized protein (TIGR02231 family)
MDKIKSNYIMKKLLFFVAIIFINYSNLFAQTPINAISTKSKLDEVTVFFNGAMLTHSAQIKLAEGTTKLLVSNISSSIDEKYIHLFASNNVKILSVEVKHNYLTLNHDSQNPTSISLKDSIKKIQHQISISNYSIIDYENDKRILDDNERLNNKANAISLIDLEKLMNFASDKRIQLNQKIVMERENLDLLQQKLIRYQNELNEIKNNSEKLNCELMINLQTNSIATTDLKISYLTHNAGWQPNYDLLVDEISKPITLKYKAKVFNNTDLNWEKIKLTLSTSNPFESSDKPNLNTWYLNYRSNTSEYNTWNNSQAIAIQQKQNSDYDGINKSESMKMERKNNINSTPISYSQITVPELAMNYSITDKYSIPSDSKPYDVDILTNELKADYEYFSVPKLDNDAFLIARISDWEELNLADGPANIFFKNNYVGKSSVNVSSTTDTLLISLGKDNKIVSTRKVLKEFSSKNVMSSMMSESSTFEIVVKNNNKDAVTVELQDQIPVSQSSDIEVIVKNISEATKDDNTGIVDWKLKLAPGETKKLIMEYVVKHPKNKALPRLETQRRVTYCPRF